MSEKRFEKWNDNSCKVKDNLENTLLNWEDVVKKLNEQQAIINKQERRIRVLENLLTNIGVKWVDDDELGKVVSLLNELVTKCHKLDVELEESSAFIIEQRKENRELRQKLDFYLLDEFEWKEKYGDCDE